MARTGVRRKEQKAATADKDTLAVVSKGGKRRRARPFLKWAGGKSQLLPELVKRMPSNYNRYFEPFLGGGALFFHLAPQRAFLAEIVPELVNAYQVVQSALEPLLVDLRQHVYSREYYNLIRSIDRTEQFAHWSNVQRASRLIYLNKTCFNGLYRVNSNGQFNTPFGRYKDPRIIDEANLRACQALLKGTSVVQGSFECILEHVQADDFVYFDPPYSPLSDTANFTAYSKDGFSAEMQVKLRDLCCELDKRGVRFMLSNSSAPLILDLYKGFKIEMVEALRAINSKREGRGTDPRSYYQKLLSRSVLSK